MHRSENKEKAQRLLRKQNTQPVYPIGNLHLQKCKDGGETYSASYLIHREHLIEQHTSYNLTWVNCEMGSFIMMNGKANPQKDINGTLLQSVDVLDFSVIHLSAYERLQRRWEKSILGGVKKMKTGNIDPILDSIELLQSQALLYSEMRNISFTHLNNSNMFPNEVEACYNQTVVIMPFLWADMGAGHSVISNRLYYLRACFWSFYSYYQHIVVAVKTVNDADFVRNSSGLPFYDVVHIPNLPKSASLPVATIQMTKQRIMDQTWDFKYIFFTESDQILMFRIGEAAYEYLNQHPRHLLLPHRLMPYPNPVVTLFHKRELSSFKPNDWMDMRCCMARQNCLDRKDWVHIRNVSVPIMNIYGLQVPLGNSNFHSETYRVCQLYEVVNVMNDAISRQKLKLKPPHSSCPV